MADPKGKGKKPDIEPKVQSASKDAKAPSKGNEPKPDAAKADPKAAQKAGPSAAAGKTDPQAQKGEGSKQAEKVDTKTQKAETTRKSLIKEEKGAGKRKTIRAVEAAQEGAPAIEEFVPDPEKTYMYNAQGQIMFDEHGKPFPGLNMWDLLGNTIRDKKGNPIPGRVLYNEESNVFLDAEGYPFLERQETTEEKAARLALEEERRRAKAFREKLEKDRVMMSTPLPKKPVKWRKYCNTMYLPRSLKTAIIKDRGTPGDDWRYFVKKYTAEEMNHRMSRYLHGRAGILWNRLHSHITYMQNPRYASENPKHIKALRIFRYEDTPKGKDWVLLDPPVAYFDGFGELASTST